MKLPEQVSFFVGIHDVLHILAGGSPANAVYEARRAAGYFPAVARSFGSTTVERMPELSNRPCSSNWLRR